jgi:hypothetical protein
MVRTCNTLHMVFGMETGCLGLIGLVLGVLILTGGRAVAPGTDTMVVGGLIFGSGLILTVVGAFDSMFASRRERQAKDVAIGQVERLARLKEQGVLTEEEFVRQKREILEDDAPEPIAPQIERLAQLRDAGNLMDEEFLRQKRQLLMEESLARLKRMYENDLIAEEEYEAQRVQACAEGRRDSPPAPV